MSVRRAAVASGLLVLAFTFVSASPARRPPAPGDKQAPTAPTNLRITASSDTSISLAWNASTDNSSNWWYCVQVDGAGCYTVNPPQTTFTRPNLMPNRTTTWTVYAIDAGGNRSGNSNAVTFTTPPDTTAPSPAPTLSAAIVVPTWAHVTWTESKDNITQVSYTVVLDGRVVWDSVGYTFFTALHFLPSSTHEFKVIARDFNGNVAESNVLTVTTPPKADDVAPTAPTNVTLGFQSSTGEAWLSWSQSTDDTDPPSRIRYEVYFDGVSHDDDGAIGSGGTIAYCRGAEPGPTEIVVRAIDTSGNVSEPSNVVPFDC
jgi:chitodextrinase